LIANELPLEERRNFAQRHVEWGRQLIMHQREMVERHKKEGRDLGPAQRLLAVLERTQLTFERDLSKLLKR
jgi:hypothetical protein